MKLKLIGLLLSLTALPAFASVTLQTQFGTAFAAAGTQVPAGTLWMLVVDTNSSNSFAGGLGLDSSLTAAQANTTFTTGQTLSVGNVIGGDTIFAIGGFSGAGITANTVSFDIGTLGITAGKNFAFYWFPGSQYVSGTSGTITGTQAGGIHTSTSEAGLASMVIPADGANVDIGAATSAGGGTLPNSRFTAVSLVTVPEPSSMMLGAVAALGLLRRRR